MKEINLMKAMQAYRKYAGAEDSLASAASWMRANAGGAWETSARQRHENALHEMEAAQEVMTREADKALSDALSEAQGRASVRTITALDILEALGGVEDKLGLTKKALDGVEVCIDLNAQDFPGAYKYTPVSTVFNARFKNGYWRVTDICREETHRASCRFLIYHTEESKKALIERFSRWYGLGNA